MRDGKSNATSALVWWSAVALRVLLITVSEVNDARSDLKYTDVDYLVYTDAAREVASGRSPYDRATFRYTPLLCVSWRKSPGRVRRAPPRRPSLVPAFVPVAQPCAPARPSHAAVRGCCSQASRFTLGAS